MQELLTSCWSIEESETAMFKSLIISLGKKYAVSAINDLLKQHKDDVSKVTSTINIWIDRLQKIVGQLKMINLRVADGLIEDKEIDDSVAEIESLIKNF